MKNHYLNVLEKEMDRLWCGKQNVAVVSLGKDKYLISDGLKMVKAKGHELYGLIKKLPNRAGSDRMWRALNPLGVKVDNKIKIESE